MPSPERPAAPVPLFFSYSKQDKALRDKLETHLSLLQTQGVISGWHDRRIEAGTEWDGAISRHLEEAGIILLLVSADFLATRYCRDVEIKRAMERHEAGTARVIPVILRPVDAWHTAPFGKLQALPEKGKAVTTWKNRDEAFADIARGIREAAMSLAAGTPNSSAPARPSAVVLTQARERPQAGEAASGPGPTQQTGAVREEVSDLDRGAYSKTVVLGGTA
ncbi:MAG TPA: toll/interleukin-1 receptor domain-containing protein, partial [Isosphaeraceae bacterium]|nr:toll/interleukin-1 receptor domain-containing protein [Isosphaeraceae bacterium]